MKRMDGNSRKGLSPLLAIIIGLVITVVAGILLAQLYFSYAATISARPSANVEYIDLIENGDNDILVVNVKNTGNIPINAATISGMAGCTTEYNGNEVNSNNPVPSGAVFSITCTGTIVDGAGETLQTTLTVGFADGSTQTYGIAVRARVA